jgi:WD40 repeat protein
MQLLDTDNDFLLGDGSEETTPQDILCPDIVFSMNYHPTAPFLAIGLISGVVEVHECKKTETRHLASIQAHDGGVAGMEFTESGSHLVSVGSDRCVKVLDCSTQQNVLTIPKGKGNPHKTGIATVNVCEENIIATGDDDGKIVLWDLRQPAATAKYHDHADYVSQLLYFSEQKTLVSTSGDTCIAAFDIRKGETMDISEPRKEELSCMAYIPASNDIICGTPSGNLPVFKFNAWRRPYDVHAKHPLECDALLTYNDNIVFTGAVDGVVRVVQHYPVRRILCHMGGSDRRRFGINQLCISHDRNTLAVAGSECFVQFHDIEFLGKEEELDKLRTRAEQRHMATIRSANEEHKKNDASDDSDDDDSDWTSDSDSEFGDDSDDDDAEAASGDDDEDDDGGKNEAEANRETKRARVAATKWLKDARKDKIDFKKERGKKRVKGFWGDIME